MVAEHALSVSFSAVRCSLAKISMVAEHTFNIYPIRHCCSLAKISMVAEPQNI